MKGHRDRADAERIDAGLVVEEEARSSSARGRSPHETMRLALVLPRVAQRQELVIGALDEEWFLEMSEVHDLELFVDRLCPITDRLAARQVSIKRSIKRWVADEAGPYRSSDAFLAAALLEAHRRRPFDAVLYTSQASTDLAWHEPDLASLPRGCVLAGGAAGDLRAVWQDERLFAHLSRRLWAMSGLMASADFLVADVAAESFGFVDGSPLPPRLCSGESRPIPPAEIPSRGLVVVAATTAGPRDLEELLPRAIDLVGAGDGLVFALLTSAGRADASRSVEVIESDGRITPHQLLVVPAGEDGVAASFVKRADLLLLASPAELAIREIAARAAHLGAAYCDGAVPVAERTPPFARENLRRRPRGAVHLVSFDELRSGVLDECGELDISPDDLMVVYSDGGDREAARLLQIGGLAGVDLVVWGHSAGLYGDADPGHVYPHALAVRAAAWPSVVRAAALADSVWSLIAWGLDLDHVDRARLLVLPATVGAATLPLPVPVSVRVPWIPRVPLLPQPRFLAARTEALPPQAPPLLSPPRPRVREGRAHDSRTLEHWLRVTTWGRRLRAALPWRWGLLERAMRSDW